MDFRIVIDNRRIRILERKFQGYLIFRAFRIQVATADFVIINIDPAIFRRQRKRKCVRERGREFADWASDEDWVDKAGLDRLNETLDSNEQYLKDAAQSPVETIRRYLDLRSQIRNIALANPDVVGRPIVFLQEERFTWQMLHEYLSYYYQECGMHGGGVYVLKEPGRSFGATIQSNKNRPKSHGKPPK